MSKNEQLTFDISKTILDAIVREANCPKSLPPNTIEIIRNWLTEELKESIRRARRKPLTRSDVERFKKVYRKFSDVIEDLQDRTLSPPRIPFSNGLTAWDEWIEKYEHFGFIGGRRDSSDWLLIGALLAFYETLSHKTASAAQVNGPTRRFLFKAFEELAAYVPEDLRSNFVPPNAEALKRQLPRLNLLALRQAKRSLAKAINQAGE